MKNQIIFWCTLVLIFSSCNSEANKEYAESSSSISAKDQIGGKSMTTANAPSMSMTVANHYDESSKNGRKQAPKKINHTIPVEERKIIKIGHFHIEVAEAEPSTVKIEAMVKNYGGFISDMNWTKSSPWTQNSLTIRVPFSNFDELWNAIGQEGVETRMKKITSNDVSEEYVDITSRLATKKQVKERYEQILRSKAQSVEEVIFAEEKIRVLQEEIEAREGRLRFLNDQVEWSTIHLVLFQKTDYAVAAVTKNTFFTKAGAAFSNGWSIITTSVLAAIHIWPLILLFVGLLIWKRSWLELKVRRKETV